MKRFALYLFCLSVMPLGVAQQETSGAALIESRQAEVPPQVKNLYGIDLRQGTWVHSQANICPAFPHHVFARYTRTDAAGNGLSFMAIYDTSIPAPRSPNKPWQGGVVFVPLHGGLQGVPLERHGTMIIFNHMLAEELQSNPELKKRPDWNALADCYIALGGEQPLTLSDAGSQGAQPNSAALPISNMLIPLVSDGRKFRAVHIEFDEHGFVTGAEVSVSPV